MATVPDAWDDDWEKLADVCGFLSDPKFIQISTDPEQKASSPPPEPEVEVKISRAERRAQHEEANKQLWESA
jgi:hypothetical protein